MDGNMLRVKGFARQRKTGHLAAACFKKASSSDICFKRPALFLFKSV